MTCVMRFGAVASPFVGSPFLAVASMLGDLALAGGSSVRRFVAAGFDVAMGCSWVEQSSADE